MSKIKVGVIFGGMSTEHDVSIVSGTSVAKKLNKDKYEVYPIYIDNNGEWYKCLDISKKYEVGDKVRHIKFGNGEVIDVIPSGGDQEIVVNFDRVGEKHLFASLVKMKKL